MWPQEAPAGAKGCCRSRALWGLSGSPGGAVGSPLRRRPTVWTDAGRGLRPHQGEAPESRAQRPPSLRGPPEPGPGFGYCTRCRAGAGRFPDCCRAVSPGKGPKQARRRFCSGFGIRLPTFKTPEIAPSLHGGLRCARAAPWWSCGAVTVVRPHTTPSPGPLTCCSGGRQRTETQRTADSRQPPVL